MSTDYAYKLQCRPEEIFQRNDSGEFVVGGRDEEHVLQEVLHVVSDGCPCPDMVKSCVIVPVFFMRKMCDVLGKY